MRVTKKEDVPIAPALGLERRQEEPEEQRKGEDIYDRSEPKELPCLSARIVPIAAHAASQVKNRPKARYAFQCVWMAELTLRKVRSLTSSRTICLTMSGLVLAVDPGIEVVGQWWEVFEGVGAEPDEIFQAYGAAPSSAGAMMLPRIPGTYSTRHLFYWALP